jgi:hypothetical protein
VKVGHQLSDGTDQDARLPSIISWMIASKKKFSGWSYRELYDADDRIWRETAKSRTFVGRKLAGTLSTRHQEQSGKIPRKPTDTLLTEYWHEQNQASLTKDAGVSGHSSRVLAFHAVEDASMARITADIVFME